MKKFIIFLIFILLVVLSGCNEQKKYQVKFLNDDGSELKVQTVEEGKSATPPTNPTKVGHTFMGWDKKFNIIYNNLEIKALYEINKYTVRFIDYDGTILKTETVEHGKNATAPVEPARVGYTFDCWDKEIINVNKNLDINASYIINKYTVRFIDHDGTILKTETVDYDKNASYPIEPTRIGYTFDCWDKEVSNVKSNLDINATYIINKYTVRFIDYNGTILKTETVEHGKNATAPNTPTRIGYTFDCWDKEITDVKSDLDINAVYNINKYTVTFDSNKGSIVEPVKVDYNALVNLPEPIKEGFSFDGWYTGLNINDPKFNSNTLISSDITLYAKWKEKVYTVNFVDWDGTSLYITEVKHNMSAVYLGKNLVRVGYEYTGWDKDFVKVINDLTITAIYKPNKYKIRFESNNDETIFDIEAGYEEQLSPLPTPIKTGHDFKGWFTDSKFTEEFTSKNMPLNGATLYAKWELSKFKIILDTCGGELLDPIYIYYSYTLESLPKPTKTDYIFDCWLLNDEKFDVPYKNENLGDLNLKARWIALSDGIEYEFINDGEEAVILKYEGNEKVLVLPDTINGKPITKIADNAFKDNPYLEEIIIGKNVIEIGDFAFANIVNLKTLKLPASAVILGNDILSGSNITLLGISGEANYRLELLFGTTITPYSLQVVEIAEGSTFITNNIIRSSIERVKLIIQSEINVINEREFYLSKFYEIVLPNSLVEIKAGAFENSRIEILTIPSSVKRIEKNAFLNCIKLSEIILPANLEFFEMNFKGCVKLTTIKVPTGNVLIPNEAFYDCISLTSIEIPVGVTSIGNNAFTNCISLQTVELPSGVTSIGKAAFKGCTNLKGVTIPEGVIRISEELFYNCTSLSEVNLPNELVVIEAKAFYNCLALTSIRIPNTVAVIQKAAFSYCKSLETVNLPVMISKIDEELFSNCTSLTNIQIPQKVTSIEAFAFYYCTSLNEINIANELTKVGDFAFFNCFNLVNIVLPEEVTLIGSFAFANCSKLKSITLPLLLQRIGEYAFSDCNNLLEITISSTVEIIERYAFNKCINLSIKCEMSKVPNNWAETWNPQNRPVTWLN